MRGPDSEEPPPAYTPNPTTKSGCTVPATSPAAPLLSGAGNRTFRLFPPAPSNISTVTTPEDPYAFLASFDTVFVIDDSGSMAGHSWREVKEALRTITPICTNHDADGIDVYFLNHLSTAAADFRAGKAGGGYYGVTEPAAVERLFASVRPGGGTPTGTRLHHILKAYMQALTNASGGPEAIKHINIIVITDGVPSDDVESVLVSAASKLDNLDAPSFQVGVQFFQVGCEPGAREALRELDDGLGDVGGGVRDMVDTCTWDSGDGGTVPVLTAEGILKTVLGAVVRRLDRQRTSGNRDRI